MKPQNKRLIKRIVRMLKTSDPVDRVRLFYQMIPPKQEFVDRTTRYMNIGYWEDGCVSHDEAGEALATQVADHAGIQAGDSVLDCGFGYGDQDFSWMRHRGVSRVAGLNITPHHVRAAQRRARREGVRDRVDFRVGSATDMPFEDNSFDHVVALESAFHFYPRSAFFAEALRVLRPGGVLTTADILPVDAQVQRADITSGPLGFVQFGIDDENWYDSERYDKELTASGFSDVRITSIRDRVWEGWRQFMVAKMAEPEYQRKIGKAATEANRMGWSDQEKMKQDLEKLDYVIAVAKKPLDAPTPK